MRIATCLDAFPHTHSSARIFLGRCSLMAKGLGTTPEEEHKPGLHKMAKVRVFILTDGISSDFLPSCCKGKLGYYLPIPNHKKPLNGSTTSSNPTSLVQGISPRGMSLFQKGL